MELAVQGNLVQYIATICFALAVLHTFSVKFFQEMAHRYPDGSIGENFFHLLGEVEVVFGIWAGIFILFLMSHAGVDAGINYLESRNFTEPLFVFVIMTVCATNPILFLCERIISLVGHILPVSKALGFYCAALVVGPLLGSLITEPAAMTVTAFILLNQFYSKSISTKFKYATLGLLFVNVSIGGTLTPYAAPPVLMVAPQWGWDLKFMFFNFGWKAMVSVLISTSWVAYCFRHELNKMTLTSEKNNQDKQNNIPWWVIGLHLIVLFGVVISSHHIVLFVGIFMLFLGVATVTKEYQTALKIRESLLVAFFLGGLVILGGQQAWWLEPILGKLASLPLYLGAMFLTAFTDNAAITYLGSQVQNITELSKYALVAGSVVGGGLTVIANAPNPAGYSTLNASFGADGISAFQLFKSALIPTIVAALCFWFL